LTGSYPASAPPPPPQIQTNSSTIAIPVAARPSTATSTSSTSLKPGINKGVSGQQGAASSSVIIGCIDGTSDEDDAPVISFKNRKKVQKSQSRPSTLTSSSEYATSSAHNHLKSYFSISF
jgi:hypothetical protein